MEKLLSAKEVAALYGVSVQTVRRWAREGKLPAKRPTGGKYYFSTINIEAFGGSIKSEVPNEPP